MLSGSTAVKPHMAFRPHPELVKLKHGITQTPLCGETQAWHPSDLVSSSMASPRLSSSSPNLILVTCFFISGSPLNWTNWHFFREGLHLHPHSDPRHHLPDIRENTLGIHRPGETQAWNLPGWPGRSEQGVPRTTIKVGLAKRVTWEYGR